MGLDIELFLELLIKLADVRSNNNEDSWILWYYLIWKIVHIFVQVVFLHSNYLIPEKCIPWTMNVHHVILSKHLLDPIYSILKIT